MARIINLTQHEPTSDQIASGVINLPLEQWEEVKKLLTFEELPTEAELIRRAEAITKFAKGDQGSRYAMIGGAPFFMAHLERALWEEGIHPVYSFSRREATEEPDGKGGVRKTQIFRHVGFVEGIG